MNEMKRQITVSLMITAAIVLLLLPRSTVTAQVQDTAAATALKAAMDMETLEGNPKGAIEKYKKIAESKDRPIAAQALIHMAESYRKLGETEAEKVYQRIVRDFADQKDASATAKARLGGASQSTGPVSRTVWTSGSPQAGYSSFGTLSPDGRFFSYRMQGNVVIHEIATGVDRNLTNLPKDSKESAVESVISPDGKRIAYILHSEETERYSVRLASLTGNPNPQTLYDNPEFYDIYLKDWSPDGMWLAIEMHRIDKTTQLGLVSVSDGTLRVLKSIEWIGDYAVHGMYFSPDSKYLGYDLPLSATIQERDVQVLAVDGSGEIPVVKQSSDNQMVGWSPDGKWLLFRSDRTGTVGLYAVAFSDGKPKGVPQRLRTIDSSFHPIGWTRSGALYYQTSSGGSGPPRMQLASLDFTTGKLLSISIPLGSQENISLPTWSPDGKHIAYLSGPQGSGFHKLAIRSIDTGTIREIRPKQLSKLNAIMDWTPDGRTILFTAVDLQDRAHVYRMNTETGDTSVVVDSHFYCCQAWMPGGLSFLIPGIPAGLYRVDVQTGTESTVVINQAFLTRIALSPDGNKFYYPRAVPSSNDVALIEHDLAAGNEKELIRRPNLGQLSLSPDGQYLAATNTDFPSNSRVLLIIPTTGGPSRELLRVPAGAKPEDLSKPNFGSWFREPSWATDSKSLLLRKIYNDPNKNNELLMVSLDGKELGKVSSSNASSFRVSPDHRYAAYTITEPASPLTTEVSVLENFLPKPTPSRK